MIVGLLTNVLFALVVVFLLQMTSGLSLKQRVGFVTGIGFGNRLSGQSAVLELVWLSHPVHSGASYEFSNHVVSGWASVS